MARRLSYGAEELYKDPPETSDGRAYRRYVADGEAQTARRLPGTTSPTTDQDIADGRQNTRVRET